MDHKPLQHLADWKRCIVPQLASVDPLREEPSLMFMRDSRCVLKYEKKVSVAAFVIFCILKILKVKSSLMKLNHPLAIRLLCFEAYHNYIHSMYPITDNDMIVLAVIFMKLVNEGFDLKQWKDFFTSE